MAHSQAATHSRKAVLLTPQVDQVQAVLFNDLWIGDRFKVLNDLALKDVIFTKTKHDQARRHSAESIALGEHGYGYLDDSIVSVKQNTIVMFMPIKP